MSGTARTPCAELVRVADVIEQMIVQYIRGLRGVPAIGRWEAPQEGIALGWLLVRNVEAVIEMARRDEVLVTAAWSNARVAFELATRIIWMLHPGDRYEAECRWLALLGEYVEIEKKLAREVPARADFHNNKADAIQMFREGVISALPSGYHVRRIPNFLDMLKALDTPEMYRFYREGSQYIHGGMYAAASYSKNLGYERNLGDFTSTVDWILPMRLCWLSLRRAASIILNRLETLDEAMPKWDRIDEQAGAAFEALVSYVIELNENGAGS